MIKVQYKEGQNHYGKQTLFHDLRATVKAIFPDLPEPKDMWSDIRYQDVALDWVHKNSTTWHQGTPAGIMLSAYTPGTYKKVRRRVMFKGSKPNEEIDETKVREKHQELVELLQAGKDKLQKVQTNREVNEARVEKLRKELTADGAPYDLWPVAHNYDAAYSLFDLNLRFLTEEQVKAIAKVVSTKEVR